MDEQNKQPEQNKPEKKLSRTTLTFYIVGLFSVAIALILISYVAQSRADKQVENLSSQLTQQQTVAQGATQKDVPPAGYFRRRRAAGGHRVERKKQH